MKNRSFNLQCPIPLEDYPTIQLAHGGGGRLMHQLIHRIFLEAFGNEILNELHDGARLTLEKNELIFTTDSYVVRPLFFPGGDIGKLAVFGTVNDIAMCGARPLYLSAGFILEEGLPMEDLWRIVLSMREAAGICGIRIVTGDTKVVDHGHGEGIYINTSGIGSPYPGSRISPRSVRPGDRILVSGDIGRHGIAVLSAREGMEFENPPDSDCAPLHSMVGFLMERFPESIRCLRDITRGGLASVLQEISTASGVGIELEESAIPLSEGVRGACEILGLDPLHVACEGRFVAFIPADQEVPILSALQNHDGGEWVRGIGKVTEGPGGKVLLKNQIGTHRVLEIPSGEQLPRIC